MSVRLLENVSLSVTKQVGVDLYSLQVIDGYCHVVKVSLSKKVKLHLSKTSQVQQCPNFYTRALCRYVLEFTTTDLIGKVDRWLGLRVFLEKLKSEERSEEMHYTWLKLCEKCPNTEFFVSVFSPNTRKYGPKKILIWTLFKIQILEDSNYKSSFTNKVNKKTLSTKSQFWIYVPDEIVEMIFLYALQQLNLSFLAISKNSCDFVSSWSIIQRKPIDRSK